jgi:hypothetical protein
MLIHKLYNRAEKIGWVSFHKRIASEGISVTILANGDVVQQSFEKTDEIKIVRVSKLNLAPFFKKMNY